LLGYLKNHKGIDGKHIIFAPKSTIFNWVKEVQRWCPEFKAVAFVGGKDERVEIKESTLKKQDFDILVTNYEMMLNESSVLTKINWKYIIVDEGHRLKNEKSMFSRMVRQLKSENRLILTGTPLQNNLHELWALLNFLLPDLFSSSEDFDTWFDTSTVLASGDTLVQRLHAILNPFFLRRIKSEVEKSLLPKIEYRLYAPITSLQRDLYIKSLKKEFEVFNPANLKSYNVTQSSQIFMNLRKICNHPYNLPGVEPEPFVTDEKLVQVCGKMQLLDKLLTMLKQQKSKVLIFTQFKGMLSIFEDYLSMRGYKYHRLDGETNFEERTEQMVEFNKKNSKTFVFLLSTRAGGLGINLQAADAVIIYDSDWNPQMDRQAEDRAHRIGQKKQVRVFRLISEKTIEERIIQRAAIKLQLDKKVIQEGRLVENVKLSKNEMVGMIAEDFNELMDSPLSSITDKSIQEIMKNSQVKSQELDEKVASSVINFESFDTIFKFDGENYRNSLKQDEAFESSRKRNSYMSRPVPEIKVDNEPAEEPKAPPPPEYPIHHDFQFYKKPLKKLQKRDYFWHLKNSISQEELDSLPVRLRWKIKNAEKLTGKEGVTKRALLRAGFDWNHKEFQEFWKWVKENGYVEKITKKILADRTVSELNRYNKTFWQRFYELKDEQIKKQCCIFLDQYWAPKLKEILEVAGGNFLKMAQIDNRYRNGCNFNRKVVAYILEKVYSEAKTNVDLFQEMSDRIYKAPYIFTMRSVYKKEKTWQPNPENMFFLINYILKNFAENIEMYRGRTKINDKDLMGIKEDNDENLKLGYAEVGESEIKLLDDGKDSEPETDHDEEWIKFAANRKEVEEKDDASDVASVVSSESGYNSKLSSAVNSPAIQRKTRNRFELKDCSIVLNSLENQEKSEIVESPEKTIRRSSTRKRKLDLDEKVI
jgi:SWI/SNF-related matrix-associated actin-dependent regulator of chromatin subfamily A member 5